MQPTSVRAGGHEITLTGGDETWRASLECTQDGDRVALVHLRLEAGRPASPPRVTLSWTHPVVDIHAFWHPGAGRGKGLQVEWGRGFTSKATSLAPVGCLHSLSGWNRLTFALSDALNPAQLKAGVHEETATFRCSVTLFDQPSPPIDFYEATLRLDTSNVPYYDTLDGVQEWWASLPGYGPAGVPETARLPMYSTWYSFHQQLMDSGVEEQCRLARDIGCEAVIVDDGWQTTSNERGYAYCGDWEVTPGKIPDMKAHVSKVHDLGMKYLLWYSVPFVGRYTRAWSRFEDKLLSSGRGGDWGVLDPRFPEVREYLIGVYERALREWDLDGFKLDFVDSFNASAQETETPGHGRDYESVPDAVDRLLTDVIAVLRALKPEVMVEFRQSYIGPLMRKYGNMFRAGDCPNDAIENRVRTLDIRLLCGDTAAHSDMLTWNPEELPQSAALQLLNVLFAVPQLSVLLDAIPAEHLEMVRFWLAFWREHRDVLLEGKLQPLHPESLYPVVIAGTVGKRVVAVYQDIVVRPGTDVPTRLMLVNGTMNDRVVLELAEDLGERQLEVRDCLGRVVRSDTVHLSSGCHVIGVPAAGLSTLSVAGS